MYCPGKPYPTKYDKHSGECSGSALNLGIQLPGNLLTVCPTIPGGLAAIYKQAMKSQHNGTGDFVIFVATGSESHQD